MSQFFERSWALVTGASSGLGTELCRQLAQRGANLVLTARSESRLEELARDLTRVNGVEACVLAADLSRPEGASDLATRVQALGVPLRHVVNNAGIGSSGFFGDLDPERESAMVELNVASVVRLTRALLPSLLAARAGGVLNVASTVAFQPVPYMATYGATKAFVVSFTLALASELEGTGVRAMALCPGPVRTGFQAAAGIARPGLPVAILSASDTVERALDAYERGERLFTPGLVNGLQTRAARWLPTSLTTWAAKRTMLRLGRAPRVPRG
jgi:short-subunit dehydrogenase